MNESQKKKSRKPDGKKNSPASRDEQRNSNFTMNAIIAVVAIVVIVAAAMFINSNYLYNRAAALTVGSTDYSAAQFNYFYRTAYSNFVSTYGDYASMFGLDTSTPLDEQESSWASEEGGTWADYFTEQTEDTLVQITATVDKAKAEGFSLSQESLDTIEENVSEIASYAETYNYSTNGYLAAVYGKGMTEKVFRDCMERQLTAAEYAEEKSESFTYTDEELAEKYATDLANDYDNITYYSWYFPALSDEDYVVNEDGEDVTPEPTQAQIDAAHDQAEEAADTSDAEEFAAKVEELTGSTVTESTAAGSSLNSLYSEWLLDSSRKEGDTTVVDSEDGDGSYAVMFISRDSNDYHTVNVRHILIQAEADEDGEYTDEALEAARTEIERIYDEWKENPTEDNFIALAEEYSEDTGSNTNGGLYENVYKGQMVEEFNDFCFDESRKSGDTAIVYGSNGGYAGYHLVYFVGEGPVYSNYLAENILRSDDYNAWMDEITEGYDVTTKYAFRFTQLS